MFSYYRTISLSLLLNSIIIILILHKNTLNVRQLLFVLLSLSSIDSNYQRFSTHKEQQRARVFSYLKQQQKMCTIQFSSNKKYRRIKADRKRGGNEIYTMHVGMCIFNIKFIFIFLCSFSFTVPETRTRKRSK